MKNNQSAETPKKQKMNKKNRNLLIFVCIFAAFVMIFGIVFGVIAMINDAKIVVKLDNASMDEGTVRVFASYYKSLHISALQREGYTDAKDTRSFWKSTRSDGKTQGEFYIESFEDYIAGILAGCSLVYEERGLTSSEEKYIKEKAEEFLNYYGSEDAFNEAMSEYGFDYDDFLNALTLSYASSLAMDIMYGYEGSALQSGSADALMMCYEYLSTYSRVKWLYLAKEMIVDDEGNDVYLTESEKAERQQIAEALREAIRCEKEDLDGAISTDMFMLYLEQSDGDMSMNETGYYFNENAEQTALLYQYQPELVRSSLDMEVGEYIEVETDDAICFIYKCEVDYSAYTDSDNPFFSDFYSDAARYFYTNLVKLMSEDAEFRDKFYDIDLVSIPKNSNFITSWK